jgi:hypothetical protein
MSEFESEDAYREFARTVRDQRRWIFEERTAGFLLSVRKASHSREYVLKSGQKLWRCQRGSTHENQTIDEGEEKNVIEREFPKDLKEMIPDSRFVKSGGRANPPGFVYLYLANQPETAMAEVRPWVGESLSVALFEITKDVRLVLCQQDSEDPLKRICLGGQKLSPKEVDMYVWSDISEAFARPVNRNEAESGYVPTQILAEAFKTEGFDGVVYKSRLAKGLNIVLFNIEVAKPLRCFLYALQSVNYTFAADPQFAIQTQKDGIPECLRTLNSESP